MATHTNALKIFAGLFRNRMQIVQELTEVYKGDVLKGREKLTQLRELIKENANRAAKSEIAGKMRVAKGFYTLEISLPTSGEMTKLKEEMRTLTEFMKSGGYRDMTVKEAWLMFLVGLEVGLWFYLGETIGKFHIVGYKVSP